jgi:hypothetical protein
MNAPDRASVRATAWTWTWPCSHQYTLISGASRNEGSIAFFSALPSKNTRWFESIGLVVVDVQPDLSSPSHTGFPEWGSGVGAQRVRSREQLYFRRAAQRALTVPNAEFEIEKSLEARTASRIETHNTKNCSM